MAWPMSYRPVIKLWPSKRLLAEDLGANLKTVQLWWFRDRIPQSWWSKILGAAALREIPLNSDALVRAEAERSRIKAAA